MFLNDYDKQQLQLATLPEGYVILETGAVQEGDIRWNVYHDSWNLSDPIQFPRHDCILGDPVSSFHGICRQISRQSAPVMKDQKEDFAIIEFQNP